MLFHRGGQFVFDISTSVLNQKGNTTGTCISLCNIQNLWGFHQLGMGFIFIYLFSWTQKLKSLECFHWASVSRFTLFLQRHWEIDWHLIKTVLMQDRYQKANPIKLKLTWQHLPVGFFPLQVSCYFDQNEGTGFCALLFCLCLLTPFPDQILTTTFIMVNYCAQMIHSCGGGSWQLLDLLLWSGFPSPWCIYQLRNPGEFCSNFFWWLPVVTFRKCSL